MNNMSCIQYYRTEGSNRNKGLERAINDRNCDEVKLLLSNGADINHTVNASLDTMLHTAKTPGIARDLLGYSASVNTRNCYKKTPLHSAVIDGKSPEFVRTLLEHEAEVNAKDANGNTPLNYAVKKTDKNIEVIKVLVLHGADINARNNEIHGYDNHCTPLDNAVLLDDLECVKALIKYTLMRKNFLSHMKTIDLRPYYRRSNFREVRKHLKDCSDEISRMKRDKMNDVTTLYQVAIQKYVCREALGTGDGSMKMFTERSLEIVTSHSYPIYHDVILAKIKWQLEKRGLANKLHTMQVYTQGEDGRKIILDSDSTSVLAKYFCKNDLFNFVVAFYDANRDGSGTSHTARNLAEIRNELKKRLCEPSTSRSCTKYFKFA